MLLFLVFGVFLLLIGITASALVAVTSANLQSATLNAYVKRDASVVELFINGLGTRDGALELSDLRAGGPGAARTAALGSQLAALTGEHEILRVEIRGLDGRVLFASEPAAVGERPSLSPAMTAAIGGAQSAALLDQGVLDDHAGPALGSTSLVREYLPIKQVGGGTMAVMAVWRDAAPVLADVARTQRDVMLVVLGAAGVLAVILLVVFRAAQVRLSRQHRQLIEAERRDPLTGMLNHGAIVGILATCADDARAHARSVAVALLDIDNFTLLNDTHGHAAGDDVLLRVAGLIGDEGAVAPHVARYGPDEFLLIWPETDAADAPPKLAALRERLGEVSVHFGESESLPVSVSIGIAGYPAHAASVTELLSAATVALQEAKAGGGDSLRVAQRPEERTASGSFDVLQGLVIAVDTKDRYTKRHSEDVARYAVFLAQRLDLDAETVATIRLSGLLHDVGKIGIPDTLLRKPSKLTAQEFDVFKQHVALGDAIVRDVPNLEVVREGIRHHHERWDGGGYLNGLAGEAIPLIGRIMAVADAFSAMTTTRPYRKALPIEEALKRLGDAAGTQLQEELVAAFITGIETAADAPMPGEESSLIWLPTAKVA
jgi:diguanylate cyclase (GGDEF)-like protein